MDIKKLTEELDKIMEDQYENEFDSEEYYVVTFTDGSKDDNFWCGDDDLFYGKKHIADLYNGEDFREIADKIRTYVEVELGKEIEEIVDGAGQSLLESLNEDQAYEESLMNTFETVRGAIETAMHHIKLESDPINYDSIKKALSKLKDATHSYKIAKDPNTHPDLVSKHLQDCYEYLQEAKKHLG